MNDRIVKLDPSEHCSVQELLPWFVNGTLDAGEAIRVREHVQGCTQCQADVDWQRRVLAAVGEESTDAAAQALAAERALARLRPRLRLRAAPRARFLPRWLRGETVWMRWALAAQALLIAGLALLLMPPAGETGGAAYRGLGAADRAADVVVMFRPDTSEQELRRILRASGARIVDGPTATDAYLLDVPDAQRAPIVAALRAQAAVALAEALDAGGGR